MVALMQGDGFLDDIVPSWSGTDECTCPMCGHEAKRDQADPALFVCQNADCGWVGSRTTSGQS
jgi:hypothetical protein